MSNYDKKKIIILNFTEATVNIYDYDENLWEDPQDMTDEDGCYIIDENCQYMIVDKLNININ